MLMAHKIALDLNDHQRTYMLRAAGVARFAYNWALEQWGIQYRAWREDDTLPKPSQFSLRKQLNEIKKDVSQMAQRSGRRWDMIVEKAIAAIAGALVGFILLKLGLG